MERKSKLPAVARKPATTEFKVHTVAPKTLKRKTPVSPDKPKTRSGVTARASSSAAAKAKTTTTARPLASTRRAAAVNSKTSTAAPAAKKPKRAAWDTKGRLEDLEKNFSTTNDQLKRSETLVSELSQTLAGSQEKIQELVTFKESLETTVKVKEEENADVKHKLESLEEQHKTALSELQEQLESSARAHRLAVQEHQDRISHLERQLEESKEAERLGKVSLGKKNETIVEMQESIDLLETRIASVSLKEKNAVSLCEDQAGTIKGHEETISSMKMQLEEMESKLRTDEAIRKRLHNTIQELKGNIRVFCRVRPLLDAEKDSPQEHIQFSEDKSIELIQSTDSAMGNAISKRYPFQFDRVFGPSDGQDVCFEEISQLVQSCLDGYNVSIFAYGQTGSGKTFTMEGDGTESNTGMIPRAVQQIYSSCQSLEEKGWTYTMEASFLEIYNESLRDLLASGATDGKKLNIRHDEATHSTTVENATIVNVTNPAEVASVLSTAMSNRSVASTNANERSSRSHSVFMLKLSGENKLTQESCSGVLNLIDLAGSERLSSSGSTGSRLKETQAINKSLSCIGDVIMALGENASHIPYRNSKLTYLLQNSLGGNSKTLMFVNLNPRQDSFHESLCSLRFATKVNAVQIGTARASKK